MLEKLKESSEKPPQSLENIITSARKSENRYCPKCGFEDCYCESIRRAAEISPATVSPEEISLEKERTKALEIKALGGLRAIEDFTPDKFLDKKILAECQESYPAQGLYLYGPTGCGKTHLASALVRAHDGLVLRPTDILRRLRAAETAKREMEIIDSVCTCRALVIDDFGAEKTTDFAATTFWEIFDRRWLEKTPGLIVTSNVGLGALSKKLGDDRITSRIAGMCKIVRLSGSDGRLTTEATR